MNTPIALKIICNIFFYIIYWVISCLAVGIGYGLIKGDVSNQTALKIAVFLFFVVAALTLIFRKYFYIGLSIPQKEIREVPQKEKTEKKIEKKEKKEFQIEVLEEETEEDGLKIKIEKEIK